MPYAGELLSPVPGAHRELEASSADDVDDCRVLGHLHGVLQRQEDQAEGDPYRRRPGGDGGRHGQGGRHVAVFREVVLAQRDTAEAVGVRPLDLAQEVGVEGRPIAPPRGQGCGGRSAARSPWAFAPIPSGRPGADASRARDASAWCLDHREPGHPRSRPWPRVQATANRTQGEGTGAAGSTASAHCAMDHKEQRITKRAPRPARLPPPGDLAFRQLIPTTRRPDLYADGGHPGSGDVANLRREDLLLWRVVGAPPSDVPRRGPDIRKEDISRAAWLASRPNGS